MPFSIPTRQITAPDPDGSKVIPVQCTGCSSIVIGATSDTKGAKLTLRIIFADSMGNVQGCTAPITLVASQVADWGAVFLASDATGAEPTFHCVADQAFIKIDALNPSTAKWTLGADAQ